MADIFDIAGRINSTSQEKVVTTADQIKDETQNKKQNVINADVARHENEIHGTGGIDSRLSDVEQMEQIVIDGGDAQIATGADFTNPDATKRAKVTTVGAIVDGLNDGVYDVSKRNPTSGPNSDGKFTLDYILDNANTLIPTGWRHGGMTISFVQSSDNKYVQARCMTQNFTADVTQWQGVDDEPTAGSDNLVKSGGAYTAIANRLIKLTGIGSSSQEAGATHIGDVFYSTPLHVLRKRISIDTEPMFETVPFIDGAIYTCYGKLYIWNGEDLVVRGESISETEKAIILPEWQPNTSYKVGNQRQNEGHYYRCTVSHTSGQTFDVSEGWTEISDFQIGGVSLQSINIGDEEHPVYQNCIKLTGIGSSSQEAGATNNGDIFYSTPLHLLRIRTDVSSFKTVPFYDGAIYNVNNILYIWNGSDLVPCVGVVGNKLNIGGNSTNIAVQFLNVNDIANHPAAYSGKTDAYNAVPSELRTLGLCITYLLSDGTTNNWIREQYVAANLNLWLSKDSWKESVSEKYTSSTEQKLTLLSDDEEEIIDIDGDYQGHEEEIEFCDDEDKKCFGITKDNLLLKGLKYTDGSDYYKKPFELNYGLNEMCVQWTTPFAIQTKNNFRKKLIWGWTDNIGNFGVSSFDERTKEIARTILGATASVDMHNSPAVFELADGRIGVVTCKGHNNYPKIWVYISDNAGDISSFGEAIEVTGWNGNTTYSQIHYINGVYYIFVRTVNTINDNADWRWKMISSTDFENWSQPKNIVLASTTQYYVRFVKVLGNSNILRMVMYSNPAYPNTDIRLGYLDVSTGNIYNNSVEEGNIVGTWDDAPMFTDFTTVIEKPSSKNQRLFDVAVTDIDNVSIAFCRWTNAYDSEYYVYNNGNIIGICAGGEAYLHDRAQLGVRFINSKNIAVARNDVNKHNDYIEIYRILQDGQVLMISSVDETNNGVNHFRVHMPMLDEDGQYLFYAKGLFDTTDYTDFDSDLVFTTLFNLN